MDSHYIRFFIYNINTAFLTFKVIQCMYFSIKSYRDVHPHCELESKQKTIYISQSISGNYANMVIVKFHASEPEYASAPFILNTVNIYFIKVFSSVTPADVQRAPKDFRKLYAMLSRYYFVGPEIDISY